MKEVLEKLMEDYPEWDTQLSEICTTLYREVTDKFGYFPILYII